MKPLGIDMAWVTVADMAQAKEFFVSTLGMTLEVDTPEYGWAELSTPRGTRLGIGVEADHNPIKAGSNAVLCITVEDAVQAKQELESKGVRCWDIHEVPGHVKMFFIQDTSGNFYHMVEILN